MRGATRNVCGGEERRPDDRLSLLCCRYRTFSLLSGIINDEPRPSQQRDATSTWNGRIYYILIHIRRPEDSFNANHSSAPRARAIIPLNTRTSS